LLLPPSVKPGFTKRRSPDGSRPGNIAFLAEVEGPRTGFAWRGFFAKSGICAAFRASHLNGVIVVKSVLWVFALLAVARAAISSAAQPYTLTKYDNPTFAKVCDADAVAPYQNHFDGAVTNGAWGICGFSDRRQPGPGSVEHNSAIFRNVGGTWKFYRKGNGYLSVAELEEGGVPVDVAQRLAAAFKADVCSRGDVPGTKWYCAKP
jgi:hypothetical protein